MDRNVYTEVRSIPAGPGLDAEPRIEKEPPPAHEKLLKHFPAEAFAMYSALDPLARTFPANSVTVMLWISLALAFLFGWFFLGRFWKVKRWQQKAISSAAFVLYVAALGGPFETLTGYLPVYGLFAAAVATGFMIFLPAPERPAP